jgi:5-methylcytosine-specific restriction endonuclease McrA
MSKHKTIPKKIREQLYEKYNRKCAYCGCPIEYKDMQIDHVESIYLHGDYKQDMTESELYDTENLLPACRQCNLYKSAMPVEKFRARITNTLMRNLQRTFSYQMALKYGLIEEHIGTIRFYFERMEK